MLTNKQLRRQIVDAVRITEPITPRCRHAPPLDQCGGCTFQEYSYEAQIEGKRSVLRQLWESDLAPEVLERIGVVGSPDPFAYRTRMDYVASKERFGLRRGGKFNYIIDLQECHLIPADAFTIARSLYERAIALGLPDYNLRTHAGFLRYIVVRRSPQNTYLFIAVSAAPDAAGTYAGAMEQLAGHVLANPTVVGFHWLVNDSVTDISFGQPERYWGAATLRMRVGRRTLQISPNTFFQNNVHLLLPLLDDVAACVGTAGQVADLYGGVGTIALHLADQVEHITCVESVAESATLAGQNIAANAVTNATAVCADVLAWLREQPGDAQLRPYGTVVVDPPRTGLGPEVCRELLRLRPDRIVYVSCNTLTQLDDARILAEEYQITQFRGYDMFPQTPHLEALAVFEIGDSR